MPDPQIITTATWGGLSSLLIGLGTFTGLMIGCGLSLLLAHALIPSLVTTGDIPEKASRLRPVLYTVAVTFFVVAIGSLGLAVAVAGPLVGTVVLLIVIGVAERGGPGPFPYSVLAELRDGSQAVVKGYHG